jgi:hypothetical protein
VSARRAGGSACRADTDERARTAERHRRLLATAYHLVVLLVSSVLAFGGITAKILGLQAPMPNFDRLDDIGGVRVCRTVPAIVSPQAAVGKHSMRIEGDRR